MKNEYHGRTDFRYHFEMYVIDIEKFNGEWCYQVASDELTYYVSEDVPAKEYTLTQIVQLCFDTIDEAIDESEKNIVKQLSSLDKLKQYRKCKCPRCGSKKIFKFCLDSDLTSMAGDYCPVNEETYYTKEEYHVDAFDRPDIEIFHCGGKNS